MNGKKFAVVLAAASILAAIFILPSYLDRRHQRAETFNCFGRLEVAARLGVTILELQHLVIEAGAALQGREELDPSFLASAERAELRKSIGEFSQAGHLRNREFVTDQALLLRLSEAPLERLWLEGRWVPGAYVGVVQSALFNRGVGHLRNAKILAGFLSSAAYVPPPARASLVMPLPKEAPAALGSRNRPDPYQMEQSPDFQETQPKVETPDSANAQPEIIRRVEPEYTEAARLANFRGACVLSGIIDTEGRVRDLIVEPPLGLGLEEKALEAVKQWRFRPALKNGKPVSVRTTFQVSFH